MDDLISRKAAIDDLLEALDHIGCLDEEDVAVMLGHLPSAQPEIIRCKDCKWLNTEDCGNECDCPNGFAVGYVDDNDYCSRAERRDDDTGKSIT